MRGLKRCTCWSLTLSTVLFAMLSLSGAARGDGIVKLDAPLQAELWQRTLDLTAKGDFAGATEAISQVPAGGKITDQVKTWLTEYQAKQAKRRALDQEDFDKYVGYAKARVEREEYRRALSWTTAALDCATDRDKLLTSKWVSDLVNKALVKAKSSREEAKWLDAWRLYSLLGQLFEHEPRYQKLEREAVTHVRLDTMFKEGRDWEGRIEKVRWKDAERAINYLDTYYVAGVDFKQIAERAIEQILLLAESKTAKEQESLKGLANEDDLADFKSRLQQRLDQIQSEPSLDQAACVGHLRRIVTKINPQTVKLPEGLLVSELMRGALDPLDDFTTMIWPSASREFDKHTRGHFVGVGISIVKNRANEIEVVTPMEDTPAYRAGIIAGDVITDVDGESIKGFSINKVVKTIMGPKGSPVTLTIRREGEQIQFPLKRARIKIYSVKGVKRDPLDEERWDHWLDKDQGIGYVRVLNFQRNTVEDVKNALSELAGLRGLVLDLRGNPGGLLNSAWQLSALFLKSEDTIVSTKGVIKNEDRIFKAPGRGAYADVPLVVLVDNRSASASEIVSGAIRDNLRGTVVGERTFGKFSVQNLITLGRSGAKLKITTARYYLPNGESLHRDPGAVTWGVVPDIAIRHVRWETFNVWEMQREANLLGPAKAKAKDDNKEDEKTADATDGEAVKDGDKEAGTKVANADDAKNDGDKSADTEFDKLLGDSSKEAGAKVASADDAKDEEDKLPPLEQPNENNRPREDPQLETARLLLRVKTMALSHPTLAVAETGTGTKTAKP